jgi:diacylglycerol kinase (ATP)
LSRRIALIANPVAGRGRAARRLPSVRRAFAAVGVRDVRLTEGPGDEARLARVALDDGCDTIAVLGGDGTWSKVARAVVTAGGGARLALLNGGTGNDFTKSLDLPADDVQAMARLAAEGVDRAVDMARVGERLVLNAAGFGFDAAVLATMERTPWLSGAALYHAAALRELFRFRGIPIAVEGAPPAPHLMLVVANGRVFGGTFRIAPAADPTDGALDVVSIAPAGPARRAQLFAAAHGGEHVRYPEVRVVRARALTLRFPEAPLYDADGELVQAEAATVAVECVPGALRVVSDRG